MVSSPRLLFLHLMRLLSSLPWGTLSSTEIVIDLLLLLRLSSLVLMLSRLSSELILLLVLLLVTLSLLSLFRWMLELPYSCTESPSEVVLRRDIFVVVIISRRAILYRRFLLLRWWPLNLCSSPTCIVLERRLLRLILWLWIEVFFLYC